MNTASSPQSRSHARVRSSFRDVLRHAPALASLALTTAFVTASTASAQVDLAPIYGGASAGARFGQSVALDGDFLIVGAPQAAQAFAYRFENGGWVADGPAWSGPSGSRFGYAVAIQGDLAIVGAPDDTAFGFSNLGSVYVFQRSGPGQWTEVQEIESPFFSYVDTDWGAALAISPNRTLVIGGPGINQRRGAVQLYTWNGSFNWLTIGYDTDATPNWEFGHSVAINDSFYVVGAPGADKNGKTDNGCAYFHRFLPGGFWSQSAIATSTLNGAKAGNRVAAHGNRLAFTLGGGAAGAVQAIYAWSGSAYMIQQTCTGATPPSDLELGYVPLLRDNEALRTATNLSTPATAIKHGGVLRYNYVQAGTTVPVASLWNLEEVDEGFGASAAISGDRLVVGAPLYDGAAGTDQGRVHTFDLSVPGWNWQNFGNGVADLVGAIPPTIAGKGALVDGKLAGVTLNSAYAGRPAFLVVGASVLALPLFTGVLYPFPQIIKPFVTDAAGDVNFKLNWPNGIPAGAQLTFQYFVDIASFSEAPPGGFISTAACTGTTP